MKKNGIFNSEISKVLADLGHTDSITISDCGLPISEKVKKIDLALKFGSPSFIETLKEVVEDMKVEKIFLAEEIKEDNKNIYNKILNIFNDKVEIEFLSHNNFKGLSNNSNKTVLVVYL